ncbi:hypothetical protein GLOIN_2v749986 [Rhizophagus irregularis DAOM 181602=DAOM 197198]|uniref:MIR domain-containing protein n=1 Tax=Rhizophagus irregularis (strain DAOM 181602 / DAOM 197198 / MUCL 43194) TaxID=747089 RepID=A0A2P4QJL6_RHIID|nr:hypothetical protein GLOIN_2v749986 [Rhizophagus irregularis DAOM 181602=DAOM 197198]POG77821.1 hypothetical protein GLOIN_2v749986 [Rhizophagus irregularis DAOM 181602=DAOM 197198]|eukprot:XP_025184687.1 hypothetical protein GLOIN_2v749986 [Rhizophagus irregularis DAOM 181602=DAOM 197198]
MKNVNSINELIKRFEEIVLEESNLIRNGSIVALKHVATGKYLSSIKNLCYTTGSQKQLVFVGSSEPIPNSLWSIEFSDELANYTDNSIKLRHVESEKFLGIYFNYRRDYYKSPLNNYTEVGCRVLINQMAKLNFYVVMIFNLLLGTILFKKLFAIMKD